VTSGSFEVKDFDDSSDSENESTGFVDGQDLCLPALRYLRQCCDIIASMCRMPACPIFTGAQRYVTASFCAILLSECTWRRYCDQACLLVGGLVHLFVHSPCDFSKYKSPIFMRFGTDIKHLCYMSLLAI